MMFQKRTAKSKFPQTMVERPVRKYKQAGALRYDRVTDCLLNGIVIGQRVYNRDGVVVLETPIQDGLKHGWEFTWDDDGTLLLVEPYANGKIHGTAKQYGKEGNVIGMYTLIHGSGFDIWRQEREDKTVFVAEIHRLQEGVPDGYEWHFASSGGELWLERYWYRGKTHGIERIWNSQGKLGRGYPRFYVLDQPVARQKYLKLAHTDKTLPIFRKEDNLPDRDFPPEIQRLLSS